MAQVGISIVKRIPFRGKTQEFANTYHYGSVGLEPTASLANDLIDEVVTEEKKFHSTAVTFLRASCWSSGGTKEENHMIHEKELTGTGASLAGTQIDPERAVLVMWRAGNDTLGRPVYLRKWYHCYGAFGTVGISNLHLTQQGAFSAGDRTTIQNYANALTRISSGLYGLVAESGRQRSGGLLSADPPVAHPWFEHHQLGDMWR